MGLSKLSVLLIPASSVEMDINAFVYALLALGP